MNSVVRSVLAVAVIAAMGWMGSTLMSSPSVAALDNAVDAPELAVNGDSASAVATLVAENATGATITSVANGPLSNGLRAGRTVAYRNGERSTNTRALALSSHAGGWWFRHSCFVP